MPRLKKKEPTTPRTIKRTAHYSGPIPLPAHLEKYEELVPGSANRLIQMAEKSLNAEIDIKTRESKTIEYVSKHSIIIEYLGQLMAFIIAMSGIGIGFYLILNNKPVVGTILGGVPLIWLVAQFIKFRTNRKP